MGSDDLQIVYVWRTAKRWRLMLAVLVAASLLTTAIIYYAAPKKFSAQAKVNISNVSLYVPPEIIDPDKEKGLWRNYSMLSFIDFVVSDDTISRTLEQTRSHDSLIELRNSVQVVKGEQDSSMSVVVTARDARKAAAAANGLALSLEWHIEGLDRHRLEIFKSQAKSIANDNAAIDGQIKEIESLLNLGKGQGQADLLARAQAQAALADLRRTGLELQKEREILDSLISAQGRTFLSQKAEVPSRPQGRSLAFDLVLTAIISFFGGLLLSLTLEYVRKEQ